MENSSERNRDRPNYQDSNQGPKVPDPIEINGELYYKVEDIIGHRKGRSMTSYEFLVKWEGHPNEEATWENYKKFFEADDGSLMRMVGDYFRRNHILHSDFAFYKGFAKGRKKKDKKSKTPDPVEKVKTKISLYLPKTPGRPKTRKNL